MAAWTQIETWPDRNRRHPVRLDAAVTRADGSEGEAVVTDLSLDGCCVTGLYLIGEELRLVIPRIGPVTAKVRWAVRGRAGLRFIRHAGA